MFRCSEIASATVRARAIAPAPCTKACASCMRTIAPRPHAGHPDLKEGRRHPKALEHPEDPGSAPPRGVSATRLGKPYAPATMPARVWVVIPTYNEAANIER